MKAHQDIIDHYLSGQMTEAEQARFERQLQEDSTLKEALEMELAARQVVRTAGRAHLKSRLQTFDEAETTKTIRPFFRSPTFLMAASLLVLLSVAIWLLRSDGLPSTSPQALFETHFEPYRPPISERGENAGSSSWARGMEAYQAKNYNVAIPSLLTALSENQAPDYLVQFYLGQSLLAMQPPDATTALAAFEEVLKEESLYQQAAKWYMALAHLHLGNRDVAIQILEELAATGDYKVEEVRGVLKKMGE